MCRLSNVYKTIEPPLQNAMSENDQVIVNYIICVIEIFRVIAYVHNHK